MSAIKAEQIVWICFGCSKERGYRAPLEGSVATCMGKCPYCDKYGTLFDLEDLVGPLEDV